MRTIIDLPDEQVQALAELCARENISRAEAIRRAVRALLEERRAVIDKAVLKKNFGAWQGLGVDADEHVAAIRREWDRGEAD